MVKGYLSKQIKNLVQILDVNFRPWLSHVAFVGWQADFFILLGVLCRETLWHRHLKNYPQRVPSNENV